MPLIHLSTPIAAPIGIVFDLSRSIDLHQVSTAKTGERAVAGRTSGLIEKGETVTWRARHFGVWQYLTSKITEMESPLGLLGRAADVLFLKTYMEKLLLERNQVIKQFAES